MKKNEYIKTLIVCALMVALSVVLKRFLEIQVPLFGVKAQSINFSYVAIMFSGLLYGPIWGGLVGVCSDLICCALLPQGAIIIGITATNFVVGALAGGFAWLFRENRKKIIPVAGLCLSVSVISSLSNSLWIWLAYSGLTAKYTYLAYALPRLAFSLCLMFPVNTVLLVLIMQKVVPVLEREKLIRAR